MRGALGRANPGQAESKDAEACSLSCQAKRWRLLNFGQVSFQLLRRGLMPNYRVSILGLR